MVLLKTSESAEDGKDEQVETMFIFYVMWKDMPY